VRVSESKRDGNCRSLTKRALACGASKDPPQNFDTNPMKLSELVAQAVTFPRATRSHRFGIWRQIRTARARPSISGNSNFFTYVTQIIAAVNNALNGCTPQTGDLTDTWSMITGYAQGSPCAGCVGATLSLTQSGQSISGSFAGPFSGCPDGMLTGTVSGTVNNSQVSLTLTDMNCATPYSSFFTGRISTNHQMGGTWSDTNSITGNWTASRTSS